MIFLVFNVISAAPHFNTFYALRRPENFYEISAGPINDVGYVGGYGMTNVLGELL